MEQLFKALKSADLIEGVRGPGGGYLLTRPASAISVAQVITAVEGKDVYFSSGGEDYVRLSSATSSEGWANLSEKLYGFLDDITVADFVVKVKRRVLLEDFDMDESLKAKNFILP